MGTEADPVELIASQPDDRLLDEDLAQLPESVGRPEELPPSRTRQRIVGVGAMLTGTTLIGGGALAVLGLVETLAAGFDLLWIVALVLGLVLVSTHWGWVHVAEGTANAIDERRNSTLLERRRRWLSQIGPYTRWEVTTSAGDDGSITILTTRHRPVACGEGRFTFVRELVARETHSAEEPAATVAERAELLRRKAAADTARARDNYEAAHSAYEASLMAHGDEQERVAALRAASEALSERINSNLREPPLLE